MALDGPPAKLEVLTLNCWGLKYLARHRNARLAEIGARIADHDPPLDIVGLQECWTQEDYESIRAQTKGILPHGKFYHSGIFGGGLAVLSRWPIEGSSMVRYPLNGRPTAFFRGDWFVGKGVACARIRMARGRSGVVEVFCTHLHAPYEREPHDSYLCHRTAQAWEMGKLLRGAAEREHLVVALGDFNMVPLSLAHRLLTAHGAVDDAWRVLHPASALGAAIDDAEKARGAPVPTAAHALGQDGATCDSTLNTWRWPKAHQRLLDRGVDTPVDPATTPDPRAKRLDYIFVGHHPSSPDSARWTVQDVRVGMTERHPTLKCSLSDHFSVAATLSMSHPASSSPAAPPPSLPIETYTSILSLLAAYTQRELLQRKLRLGHFVAQLFITVGCLTGIWYAPHPGVAVSLALVGALGLAAGVMDGLIGGLFVGSELRALREFAWEVTSALHAAPTSSASAPPETQAQEKQR
ncbi:MAG: phospholipase C type enzyme [Thelocarpon impressellum]|nr:MAG: phospholipase C type enzyme [Thelocarpon impressellum]